MRMPPPPPDFLNAFARQMTDPARAQALTAVASNAHDDHLPWRRFRFIGLPADLDERLNTASRPIDRIMDEPAPVGKEEWWFALRSRRRAAAHTIEALTMADGTALSFVLTDDVLRSTDFVASQLSGQIGFAGDVATASDRQHYLKTALEEEAITSSQLEGAVTTRRVAKEMLRSGRRPHDISERMIANNYAAMQRVREICGEPLTPALVCELHAIVTEGTLDDPRDAGRLQTPEDRRVTVQSVPDGEVIHRPPPADELPGRLTKLCDFANDATDGPYLPRVLRALTVHFMTSYDHYFVDGNGRTARALFYWSMLHQGYWLAEYLTVSTILRRAPSQYALSFIDTEQDDADLTYFYIYHLDVLRRAIDGLRDYIARAVAAQADVRRRLDPSTGEFNLRQIAVLTDALHDAPTDFTASEISSRFAVTDQTARADLDDLAGRGYLTRRRVAHRFVWTAALDLGSKLAPTQSV